LLCSIVRTRLGRIDATQQINYDTRGFALVFADLNVQYALVEHPVRGADVLLCEGAAALLTP
jgi:hypothetical protein